MSSKQIIKQRKSYIKGKLKGKSKEKTKEVMDVLEKNIPVNEIMDILEKTEIFSPRDLNDIKKHYEMIELSDKFNR